MRKAETTYSELALAREAATNTVVGRDSRQAEEWKSFIEERGEAPSVPWLEAANRNWGVLDDWLREYVQFFPIVPKLEVGTNIREVYSY